MTAFIKKLADNPLWVFGWSMFTVCIGYIVSHEYIFPEDANYFQHRTMELNRKKDEIGRAEKVIKLWSGTISTNAEAMDNLKRSFSTEAGASENIRTKTTNILNQMTEMRRDFSKPIVLLKNTYFEDSALQGLLSKLLQDIELADRMLEKRILFLNTVLTNITEAGEMVSLITSNIEEERAVLEGSTRQPMIDHILDRVRGDYNESTKDAQSKAKMYKMRSKAAVAAWTYVGGFIGAVLGWLRKQRRLAAKRLTEKTQAENAQKQPAPGRKRKSK